MTYLIVMSALGGVMCLAVLLFLYRVVPAQERRAAARARLEEDPHDAAVRDVIRHATSKPDECSHDDVLEDWHPQLSSWDQTVYGAPRSSVLNEAGVCRQCGARVVRHGRPNAWTEWMIDPTSADSGTPRQ